MTNPLIGYKPKYHCNEHNTTFEQWCDQCYPRMAELIEQQFVIKSGQPWPVYDIRTDGKGAFTVWCHWRNGNISGFGDIYELHQMLVDGALEFVELSHKD